MPQPPNAVQFKRADQGSLDGARPSRFNASVMIARAKVFGVALLALGCVVPRPSPKLPDTPYIAVLSGQMPPPLDEVARHGWIVLRPASGQLHRFEYGGHSRVNDPFSDFAAGDVMVHGVYEGSPEEIAAKDVCLAAARDDYYREYPGYFPIPGPNSNTFVAFLIRRCHLGIELPASAIGRDYVGLIGADLTEARTGIQLGTFPFGLRLGLREGIEVHFFGLPLGVHFWPPGINVPVNPGRIGFASDAHIDRPRAGWTDDPFPDKRPSYAVASVQMFASGRAVIDRSRALGLAGEATLALAGCTIFLGRVGHGTCFDLEAGSSFPFGFAYGAHLLPVGIGVIVTPTGYIGVFSGIGASGVAARVPSGLEFPQELRIELDLSESARIALRARGTFVALEPARRHGKFGFDETSFGISARFGRSVGFRGNGLGSGYFFGFERREIVDTAMVGLLFGTEIDVGYSLDR